MSLLVSEKELLQRCQRIEGINFSQLAAQLNLYIPRHASQRKGWAGLATELALGTTAGNKSLPDFTHLGIELKTIPLSAGGKVAESTFITSIPLLSIHRQTWLTSQCYLKLKRVLWLPVEGDRSIPFEQRRIGRAFLWSPNEEEHAILANDWQELSFMIRTGKLSDMSAKIGQYLQIRPKAANAKSLCYAFDEEGNKILTLPRGFYLRSSFTNSLIKNTM